MKPLLKRDVEAGLANKDKVTDGSYCVSDGEGIVGFERTPIVEASTVVLIVGLEVTVVIF